MHDTSKILSDHALNMLFREARTYSKWQDRGLSDVVIHALYDLLKMGPTSANCSPARFIFVRSKEAKEKLSPCLDAGNVDKTMAAPLTAIIINDFAFYDKLPQLFPHADARSWYAGKPQAIEDATLRNAALQGAYLIMAARALGLDCGPMSGFNKDKVKAEFFPEQKDWHANFLCNIGYGEPDSVYPRLPRLNFADACDIV